MADISTADDYAWLSDQYEDLMDAYCVTLVNRITPEELLESLGAETRVRIAGVAGLCEPSFDVPDDHKMFVGVAPLGEWSLMVEYNGYLGITGQAMLPISSGRTVVSHFYNVNGVNRFCWYENGDARLTFEPDAASHREGSNPDDLLTEMQECGFDLTDDDWGSETRFEAPFALAERITGVRLTPQIFASAEFLCGLVREPR
ncbi:DUF6461 domain-containing protein [Streptomyces sp. LP11]|uniref:DUF6461 domain-containing protein n=1 Tax=Streptomyces pyxinicus TaxID=2970331 RepID=A0ABT2B5C0_9ACTN|nr:DUF6461 domain-containing protein [Streptomyces sp. LP11]MCS0603556.1 DUF6461 domain-containing protein [Streptomyces sp. LP11]